MPDPTPTPPAGREMDAEVAREVMGWKIVQMSGGPEWQGEPGAGAPVSDWMPSQDIAAAWKVVERLKQLGHVVLVKADGLRKPNVQGYTVQIDNIGRTDDHSAPLAICLAAMRAVRGERERR